MPTATETLGVLSVTIMHHHEAQVVLWGRRVGWGPVVVGCWVRLNVCAEAARCKVACVSVSKGGGLPYEVSEPLQGGQIGPDFDPIHDPNSIFE